MLRLFALLFTGALLASCASPHFTGTALPNAPAPDFTLTSDAGTPWTLSHQRGQVVALFFGFTHCTDTCPDTLAKLNAVVRRAASGRGGSAAEIAFVTIDPARDTPAVMRAYVQRFPGSNIVGLTGTQAQIDAVMHSYNVWTQREPGKGDDYDEDHSAFTFLIDRNGNERVLHNDDDAARDYAADVTALLES
jgi:protein SCO1